MKYKNGTENKKLILCADLGTSSLKAALVNKTGSVFAQVQLHFDEKYQQEKWLYTFENAVQQITIKIGKKHLENICAISISGNGPSLASLDFSYLWHEPLSKNTRTILEEKPTSSIFIPRLLEISTKFPPSFLSKNKAYIHSLPEFLVYQLTNKAYTLLPEKRYKKAYWNKIELKKYNLDTLSLPPFLSLGKKTGNLTYEMSQRLGLKRIPVFCTGPDFIAAIIGSATVKPGTVCDRAGSSEGINICIEKPLYKKGIRTLPSPIKGLWNASYILPNTGIQFSINKKKTKQNLTYSQYVEYLLKNPSESGYLLMKEIALQVKKGIALLEKEITKAPLDTIICTGGQAKNEAWMQFKASILNRTLSVPECKDSELIGCAATAFYGLKEYKNLEEAAYAMLRPGRLYTPNT